MKDNQLSDSQLKRIDEIKKEWCEEVKKISVHTPPGVTFSNMINKPYWDLEKKYKKMIEEVKKHP